MNTLTHVGNLFAFIGGLGMFLYGMDIMASGLQKTAGNKMKDLLGYLTNNRILGVLVGALVTAIIQSSSATTVMVVGFVNARDHESYTGSRCYHGSQCRYNDHGMAGIS